MPDWNGDGKQDWHDDYTINEIIPKKKDKKSAGNAHVPHNAGCSVAVFIGMIILWGMVNLLAGWCS